jgi:hypothetical protein
MFIFQESLRLSGSKVLHNSVTVKLVRLTEMNLNKPYSKLRNSDVFLTQFLFRMI